MSKAKFEAAKELIQSKHYSEARALLGTINHPLAAEWTAKIDRLAPDAKAAPASSRLLGWLALLTAMIALLGFMGMPWVNFFIGINGYQYAQIAAPIPALGLGTPFGNTPISLDNYVIWLVPIAMVITLVLVLLALLSGHIDDKGLWVICGLVNGAALLAMLRFIIVLLTSNTEPLGGIQFGAWVCAAGVLALCMFSLAGLAERS